MTTKDRDRYGMKPFQVYQTSCVCSLLLCESTVWEKNKCQRKDRKNVLWGKEKNEFKVSEKIGTKQTVVGNLLK